MCHTDHGGGLTLHSEALCGTEISALPSVQAVASDVLWAHGQHAVGFDLALRARDASVLVEERVLLTQVGAGASWMTEIPLHQ